jgi:5,5'-dehydrodivanillate O-demethylase
MSMSARDNELLTRVGPGTPMGDLLRRYWHPVCASVELEAAQARRVDLLGESFVAFRDSTGGVALLDNRCAHRGMELDRGHVDEAGVRCPYHGWQFGPDGSCVDLPTTLTRPASDGLRSLARVRAHLARELGGLVFAYVGPEPAPELPRYDVLVRPGGLRDVGIAEIPCNWLQIMENSVDPVHVEWLHGHYLGHQRRAAGLPEPRHYTRRHQEIGFDRTDLGIVKRRVLEGGSRADDDWRVGHPLVFPLAVRVGAGRQHRMQIRVPLDDTRTRHYWYSWYDVPHPQPDNADVVAAYEVPWQHADGSPILDYVDGTDIYAWVSQGAIADRTRELLGPADAGIVLYRRMLKEALALVADGQDPPGVLREAHDIVEFPQEEDKYRGGGGFLADSLRMSHVRYSPHAETVVRLLVNGA